MTIATKLFIHNQFRGLGEYAVTVHNTAWEEPPGAGLMAAEAEAEEETRNISSHEVKVSMGSKVGLTTAAASLDRHRFAEFGQMCDPLRLH